MNASRTSSSFSHRLSTFEAHRRSPSPFVLHSRSAQMQFLLRTSTQHRQGKLSLQSSFTFQTQPIPFFEHLSLLSRCDLSILKATRFMSFPFEGTNLRRFSPWVAPPGLPPRWNAPPLYPSANRVGYATSLRGTSGIWGIVSLSAVLTRQCCASSFIKVERDTMASVSSRS